MVVTPRRIIAVLSAALVAALATSTPEPAQGVCMGAVQIKGKDYVASAASFPSRRAAGARVRFTANIPDCQDVVTYPPGPQPPRIIGTTVVYKIPGIATTLAVGVPDSGTGALAIYTKNRKCQTFAGNDGSAARVRGRLLACLRWHTLHPR